MLEKNFDKTAVHLLFTLKALIFLTEHKRALLLVSANTILLKFLFSKAKLMPMQPLPEHISKHETLLLASKVFNTVSTSISVSCLGINTPFET